ncbi:MAG: DUF3300 domain-containing protein [Planctomycetota bacterium]
MNMVLKITALSFVLLGTTSPQSAQEPTAPTTEPTALNTFTSDRLEQMAAPIALYPDALVAQILMAATYPLEVVEASRFVQQNPDLRGPALEEALKLKEWDPSVKALCGFPTVLKMMDENLSWTRDLGDAFLVQQAELMDTIQVMRLKAIEAGTLETTPQQEVIREERIVVIQPADPEVIYVPVYSPTVVYGPSWYYPTWYYPGCYPSWGHSYLSFSIGVHWGWGLWGGFNWHDHGCHIDPYRYNHFNTRTCHSVSYSHYHRTARHDERWEHNPRHRRGVEYKDPKVARQFGAEPKVGRGLRGLLGDKQSNAIEGRRGSQPETERRALPGTSDSAKRSPAPKTDRSRTGAIEQKKGSGPAASRGSREQAPRVSPSTPGQGREKANDRKSGTDRGNDRSGSVSGGRAVDSGARFDGARSRSRSEGAVSGSGRSGKASSSGSADRGARTVAPPSGGRSGGAVQGGERSRSPGGRAIGSGAQSRSSSGGSRSGGAINGSGRGGKSSGGGAVASGRRSGGSSGGGSRSDGDRKKRSSD